VSLSGTFLPAPLPAKAHHDRAQTCRPSSAKENALKRKTNPDAAFRLSRVERDGWNQAQRTMTDDAPSVGEDRISMLNPYPADPERARWTVGFKNALATGERR
jgi:hypothetical protein